MTLGKVWINFPTTNKAMLLEHFNRVKRFIWEVDRTMCFLKNPFTTETIAVLFSVIAPYAS